MTQDEKICRLAKACKFQIANRFTSQAINFLVMYEEMKKIEEEEYEELNGLAEMESPF